MTPASPRRGFTLLEVMVALALLAMGLAAIADLVGGALRNHAFARQLSEATLLARGKMAELTQQYEDSGFRDFDEQEDGTFHDQGRDDVRWRVSVVRPDGDLSADQVFAAMGGGADPQELLGKLMGGGSAAGGQGGPTAGVSPLAGAMTGMLQMQLTAFGETIKKSFRELRLTVSWRDGKQEHRFTVTTHLLVLHPRAAGGARGDDPEIPPDLVNEAATAGALQNRGGQGGQQGQGTPLPPGTVLRRGGATP